MNITNLTVHELRDKIKNDKTTALETGRKILEAVGGEENIVSIDNCFTRLRLELKDLDVLDEQLLKDTGSKGIVKRGQETQIIFYFIIIVEHTTMCKESCI